MKAQVYSEIGRLERVILHRPGRELNNLIPQTMHRLLYDDLPDCVRANAEFEQFIQIFRDFGAEPVFIEDLLAEVLERDGQLKERFVDEFLSEIQLADRQRETLKAYYLDFSKASELVDEITAGIRKDQAPFGQTALFEQLGGPENPMIIDPLPNMVFTRDPFVIMGEGVCINSMCNEARRRETLFGQYIFDHHPDFKGRTPQFLSRGQKNGNIEGGDILVLSPEVVAVGLSQRTSLPLVKELAKNLLSQDAKIKHVLAIQIPQQRAFMHLDTVCTMVDVDKFVVHPAIEGVFSAFDLILEGETVREKELQGTLDQILARYLGLDKVTLIRCGGGSVIDAAREQWNDGSNTVALAPGEIIVYERNHVTNRLLEEAGIILHKLPASELARGRGGPHCMSMPLTRAL